MLLGRMWVVVREEVAIGLLFVVIGPLFCPLCMTLYSFRFVSYHVGGLVEALHFVLRFCGTSLCVDEDTEHATM